jgi:hypothetical protein
LNYPVPPDALRTLLREARFDEVVWEDTTAEAIAMAHRRREVVAREGFLVPGTGMIVRAQVAEKAANALRN